MQLMDIGFVIGNGTSRKDIDLNLLKGKGTTYGCNKLYLDFTPDVLVSVDTFDSKDIQKCGYALRNKFYALEKNIIEGSSALPLPWEGHIKKCSGKDTGVAALHMAMILGRHDTVYLLGFDFGSVGEILNHLYNGYTPIKKLTEEEERGELTHPIQEFLREHNINDRYIRVVNEHSRKQIAPIKEISVDEFIELWT